MSPYAVCPIFAAGWLVMGCSTATPPNPTQALADLHSDRNSGLLPPHIPASHESSLTGLTNLSQLPSEGSVHYTGAVALEDQSRTLAIIGALSVVANFGGQQSINGLAENFTGSDNKPFRGTLYLSNGIIDPSVGAEIGTSYPVTADLTGSLTDDVRSYAIDAQIGGHFIGADYNGIAGFADGTVTSNIGQDTIAGVFNVER
nr:hypothetical protein [Flavimaricola sp.]